MRSERSLKSIVAIAGVAACTTLGSCVVPGADDVQGIASADAARRPPPGFRGELRPLVQTEYDAPASASSGGRVATLRSEARADAGFALSPKLVGRVRASFEHTHYDWGPGATLAGTADPIDDAYHSVLMTRWIIPNQDGITWVADLRLRSGYESGADFDESLSFFGLAAGRYRVDDSLLVMPGVIVLERLTTGFFALPYVGIEWDLTPKLRLETDELLLRLGWEVADDVRIGPFAEVEIRDFRLADDSRLGRGATALADDLVRVGLEFRWSPSEVSTLRAHVGSSVYRDFDVRGSGERFIGSEDLDPSIFVGLEGRTEF